MSSHFFKKNFFAILVSGLPAVIGLVVVPKIVHNVGHEEFGIFTMSIAVLGFAGVVDLGMGRLLSRGAAFISEEDIIESQDSVQIKANHSVNNSLNINNFNFGLTLVLIFSIFTTAIVSILFYFYGQEILHWSPENFLRLRDPILWVILSIPAIALTGAMRGWLEGLDKFGIANKIQLSSSIGSFLVPAIATFVIPKISFAFLMLLIYRYLVLGYTYLKLSKLTQVFMTLKGDKLILKDSFWLSLSALASPALLYSDRLALGTSFSLESIAYYGTAIDLVLRVLIIPQALSRVMLPSLVRVQKEPNGFKNLLLSNYKLMSVICFSGLFLLGSISFYFLKIWLGLEMAQHVAPFIPILALGVFWNCMSWVTINYFQALGKFKFLTILYFFSMVLYLLILPLVIKGELIHIAYLWSLRFIFDTFILSYFVVKFSPEFKNIMFFKISVGLIGSLIWLPLLFIPMSPLHSFEYFIVVMCCLVLVLRNQLMQMLKSLKSELK